MFLLTETELRELFGERTVEVMLRPDFWFCKIYKNENVTTTVSHSQNATIAVTVMNIEAFVAYRNNCPWEKIQVELVSAQLRDLVDHARLCPQIVRLKTDSPQWGLQGVDPTSVCYVFETIPPLVPL